MNSGWVFCFLWLPGVVFSFESQIPKEYFIHLKALEYDKAKVVANNTENAQLKHELWQLADILYFEGEQEETSEILQNDGDEDTLNSEIKILRGLNKGYIDLFTRNTGENPYESFYKAYVMAKSLGNKELLKICLLAFFKYHNYEIAQNSEGHLVFLESFKDLREDLMDEVWATIYSMIFYSKTLDGLPSDYFVWAARLDELEGQLNEDSRALAFVFYEKALKYDIEGDTEMARTYYKKTIDASKNYPFAKYTRFFANMQLLRLETGEKNFKEARTYLDHIRRISFKDTLRAKYYIGFPASEFYGAQSDYDKAYRYLKETYLKGFAMDYRKNTLEMNRMNVELQTEEKEKQLLIQTQKNKANRNWLIAVSLTLILGMGIAILLQKNTTKKRLLAEQESQLKQQRVENLLKEQELVSIDAMIEGQEKERQKVANELHDDLGSLMATIKLHFDNAKVSEKDPAMQNAQKLLEEAYQKIRGMAHSKNSGVMSDQGLLPAIKKMARTISETNALNVTVEDFGLGERLENSLELTIFRMVQELVANAIKHANATKVGIHLTQHEDQLNIIVEDNGSGFDSTKVSKVHNGMGLTTIEKRVEHLEGNFTIDSVLGKGTSILIDIPV
ncbi:tetratricopeptide repeat-containing sensor histidine kinase [Flagellimonas sp.]|uniref:tetratricopeptide repeat-containing sensor histidine kinase n=1 Tax=Flagellimonas sp. TaxID=2058762 RepID=UPI003B519B72